MLPVNVAPVASRNQVTANIPSIATATTPTGADRLLGAIVCSGEAVLWMISAFLWFAIWGVKLTLMVGFAVLRIRLK
jgi:hypothetical protein